VQKLAKLTKVVSNHFTITIPQGRAYQWIAEVFPEIEKDSREILDSIFNINMRDITRSIGKFVRASNCLYTFDMPSQNRDVKVFEFKNTSPDFEQFTLTLKRQDNLIRFQDIAAADESRFEVIRVLNFFVKKLMGNLNFKEYGRDRKFYNQKQTAEVDVLNGDFSLEIMKGYKTAVEYYRSGPKLLIDCTRRIIRQYDMQQEMDYFTGVRKMHEQEVLDEYVIGRIFMTTYGNNKMYKIIEVDKTKTPLSLFPDQTKAKTYKEYFKKQYNVTITIDK
jgi:hypothetical protein